MISMFDTRVMLPALEQMFSAKTYLRDTFFKNTQTFETETVDIDVYKGKRRVAVYVSPTDEGQVVTRAGYSTKSYKPPYIKEKMPTSAEDVLKRTYGENVYSTVSPMERAQRRLAMDLTQLDELITRAEEVQAAQALFTGTITLRDANEVIDFGMLPTHKITNLTHLWTDTAQSHPLTDLKGWRRMLLQDSGVNPNVIIMGTDAVDAFTEHPDIVGTNNAGGALSPIQIDRGRISPQNLPDGVTYWGYLKDVSCDVYSYDEWYQPFGSDTEFPMVPANKIMMGSTNARMDRLYGAIKDLSALYAVSRFPKSWEEEDPSLRWIMLQSSPLLVPVQVDSYMFAQVTA